MPFKPETTAWIVTVGAFLAFCLLCTGSIVGTDWYLRNATHARTATVSPIDGTVTIWDSNKQTWIAIRDDEAQLEEGFVVSTDKNARALITLFDNSTVEVFHDTQLKLSRLRVSRFEILAPRANTVTLEESRGKIRVGVARPLTARTDFTVRVPQGVVALDEGSYIVEADDSLASVRVRDRGAARVSALDQVRLLREQQRVEVLTGKAPSDLLPSAQELVRNGEFRDGMKEWTADPQRNIGFRPGEDVAGTITLGVNEGQPAVRFMRIGSQGTHAEPTIGQSMNRDLSEFSVLRLGLRFKLVSQSLGGGGYMGSEYPLLVKVIYGTEGGGEMVFVAGFYYQNLEKNRTDNGRQVPQGTWVDFVLPDNLMTIQPAPRVLKSVEVVASGWDFESHLGKISLIGE